MLFTTETIPVEMTKNFLGCDTVRQMLEFVWWNAYRGPIVGILRISRPERDDKPWGFALVWGRTVFLLKLVALFSIGHVQLHMFVT